MIAPNPSRPAPPRLVVTIPGEPVAQGRGRAFRVGNGIRMFDPAKSRGWKRVAAVFMAQARNAAGVYAPLDGPLDVAVVATWATLKSAPKKNPPVYKVSRPDGDNVLKAVLDAGNGILWADDAMCVRLSVEKRYGAVPSVRIEINRVGDHAERGHDEPRQGRGEVGRGE